MWFAYSLHVLSSNIELLTSKCVYTKYACAWTFSAIWCDTQSNVQLQHPCNATLKYIHTENWNVQLLVHWLIFRESIFSTFKTIIFMHIKYWGKKMSILAIANFILMAIWTLHCICIHYIVVKPISKWNAKFSNSTNVLGRETNLSEKLFRFNFSDGVVVVVCLCDSIFYWNYSFLYGLADVWVFAN